MGLDGRRLAHKEINGSEVVVTETQIHMDNFECPTVRSQLKMFVEELAELCPSDAAVRATFRCFPHKIVAEIKVASQTVCMHAVDQAQAVTDVISHLRNQMLAQIFYWREHRFAS